jgi:hypothetical protein
MIKKSLSLTAWIFVFQLIAYFANEEQHYRISTWYQSLNKSPFLSPRNIFLLVTVQHST